MSLNAVCRNLLTQLSAYVDGELVPKERVTVEQHLASCKDCTARVSDLRAQAALLRVGLEMRADEVDFSGFSQRVMARLTPERAPFWERVKLSATEMFTYQRGAFAGGAVALAAAAVFAVGLTLHSEPPGTAATAVNAVTTDESAHVAPVVMRTEQGTIIWLVDHADHVNAKAAPGTAAEAAPPERPKGGEL